MIETANILDRLLEPVGKAFTADVARQIAALRADAVTQARLDLLANRNSDGTISTDERQEYEALVNAGNLIAVLQAKARAAVNESDAA